MSQQTLPSATPTTNDALNLTNRWLTIINTANSTLDNKKRCCSFCKNEGHTIQKCTSIRIDIIIDKIELKINSCIMVLVDEIRRLSNIGSYNQDHFTNLIRSFVRSWIHNYDKNTLLALAYRLNKNYESIYEDQPQVFTKMNKSQCKEIIIYRYTVIILDAINLHCGVFTLTFKKYIVKHMLKFLRDTGIHADNPEIDAMEYYNYIHGKSFYEIKLNNLQILDVLKFMQQQQQEYFYYYYLLLGQAKCMRITMIITHIESYLRKELRNNKNISIAHEFIREEDYDINAADFDCSICFENYNCKKEIKLNCSHVFCKECIFTTIEINIEKNKVPPCPLCRTKISKVSIKDEFDYLDYIEKFQEMDL